MSKIPDSFCYYPWTGIYVNSGTTGPCCVNTNVYNKNNSIESYLKSKELKDLKESFIKGNKPASCKTCWKEEELGIESVRKRNTVISKDYYYFTIRLSNKCNFTCRMCNQISSSAWALDEKAVALINYPVSYSPFNIENFKQNIEFILNKAKNTKIILVVLGGEPLISDEFIYLLNKCNEYNIYKNITLSINTNLSVITYKNVDYKKEFSKFYKVKIHASIDGLEKVGEYIRRGFKQNIFNKNLNILKEFVYSLNIAIQTYNIYDIPNIYKYAEKNNIKIYLGYVHGPKCLSIQILDDEERSKIKSYYDSINFNNKGILGALLKEDFNKEKVKEFIEYTKGLDSLWKTNFTKSIPELANWYERIQDEKYNMV